MTGFESTPSLLLYEFFKPLGPHQGKGTMRMLLAGLLCRYQSGLEAHLRPEMGKHLLVSSHGCGLLDEGLSFLVTVG